MTNSNYDEKLHWADRAILGVQNSAQRARADRDAMLEAEFLNEHLRRTVHSYFDAKIKPENMVSLLNNHWDVPRSQSLEIIDTVERARARKQRRAEIDKNGK